MTASTKRRGLLVAALGLLTLALPFLTNAAPRGDDRRDIVVFMVDDLGAIDKRILDRLPNIRDLFLNSGLRFDAAYSETPLCCPGRASFLTGEHTRTHGVVINRARLLDPTQTVATALHDAGYYTIMAGKYLNYPDQMPDKTPDGWDSIARQMFSSGKPFGLSRPGVVAWLPIGDVGAARIVAVLGFHIGLPRLSPANDQMAVIRRLRPVRCPRCQPPDLHVHVR